MATRWLKLEGETAEMFNDQYGAMLEEHDASEEDFSPTLFVRYLLDIRQKALTMHRADIVLPELEGGENDRDS